MHIHTPLTLRLIPRARGNIESGRYTLQNIAFPAMCYKDFTVNDEDIEDGLFKSNCLVCRVIDILYGPSAVDVDTATLRSGHEEHGCAGKKHDVTEITVYCSLCCGCWALCNHLTDQMDWTEGKSFNYGEFYRCIVWALSDKTDDWAVDTMEWWNPYALIFPASQH
ncbi:hypothetical protein BC834DRAFT_471100 [Gloeopeniophorella convolvens]|nr:hypothetical protein BC834DRAFT_471100 [Gloeopeniophorella convolvens]